MRTLEVNLKKELNIVSCNGNNIRIQDLILIKFIESCKSDCDK